MGRPVPANWDQTRTVDRSKWLPHVPTGQIGGLLTCYDAVAVQTIQAPAGPVPSNSTTAFFFAYIDGTPTYEAIRGLFPVLPLSHIKTITDVPSAGNLRADIADCEAGAFDPQQAAQWCYDKIKGKVVGTNGIWRPTTYVEIANRNLLIEYLADFGLEYGRDVDNITAWWNGVPELVTVNPITGQPLVGEVGHQWTMVSRFTYDISVELISWWGLPQPPPPKGITEGDSVFFNSDGSGKFVLYQYNIGAGGTFNFVALDQNYAVAVQTWANAVQKATGVSPIIQDVAHGMYNRIVLGDPTKKV